MTTPKGPAKAPKEPSKEDSKATHNNFLPSGEIRELLSQDHSMQSIQELQDNWDRIPRAFKKEVIDYLSDALKEYGKTSAYGKKIENFLTSILSPGSEVIRKIEAAIHPARNVKEFQNDIEKILRITKGMAAYEEYFSTKATSLTADKLSGMLDFLSEDVPDAKIQRLALFSFNQFFRPDGEVRIAKELERVRKLMLDCAKKIHSLYDRDVEKEISSLREELKQAKIGEKKSIEFQIKQLQKFLDLPGNLEIKNAAIDEISARLKARNIKNNSELNRPPDGGIFRIALRDCTIEGRIDNKCLKISIIPFSPAHLLTYAMNAKMLNEDAAKQARQWWEFTVDVLGYKGAMTFYEMCGYLMITRHPLPTERTILIIIGDPGSGKGTHLAATQEMLTYDQIRLFAKADPHKLTDPREHFSRQNLQGKLALISGDLKHTKIRDFSEVNDLFGGEPQEIEKKFRDPTTEDPIFKAIWAITPPLFKVDQAGGAWRRTMLLFTRPVPNKDRDNGLKLKMLSQMDGFFLNALIGLSYLATGGWKFTGELTDAELEELWTFHSDSVQVWAQNMSPEPDAVESEIEIASTLDGKKMEHVSKENTDAMHIVDDLYAEYADWCARKEIEPVKPKTFSAWLGNHGYILKKKGIEEGRFKGERKIVTFAGWIDDDGSDEDLKTDRTEGDISWEAYYSQAPLTLDNVSDSHGQLTRNEIEKKENDNYHDHDVTCIELPSWIGHMVKQSPETANIGFPRDSDPCPIRFEKQEVEDSFKNKNDPETIKNPSKSDAQSKRKRWELNPKLELFNLVEEYAPKSKYHSLTAKAIDDMIAMYGIDLSTIHDLCEELARDGAFLKDEDGGYSVSRKFILGGDSK